MKITYSQKFWLLIIIELNIDYDVIKDIYYNYSNKRKLYCWLLDVR